MKSTAEDFVNNEVLNFSKLSLRTVIQFIQVPVFTVATSLISGRPLNVKEKSLPILSLEEAASLSRIKNSSKIIEFTIQQKYHYFRAIISVQIKNQIFDLNKLINIVVNDLSLNCMNIHHFQVKAILKIKNLEECPKKMFINSTYHKSKLSIYQVFNKAKQFGEQLEDGDFVQLLEIIPRRKINLLRLIELEEDTNKKEKVQKIIQKKIIKGSILNKRSLKRGLRNNIQDDGGLDKVKDPLSLKITNEIRIKDFLGWMGGLTSSGVSVLHKSNQMSMKQIIQMLGDPNRPIKSQVMEKVLESNWRGI